jgi:hypothetical protein
MRVECKTGSTGPYTWYATLLLYINHESNSKLGVQEKVKAEISILYFSDWIFNLPQIDIQTEHIPKLEPSTSQINYQKHEGHQSKSF